MFPRADASFSLSPEYPIVLLGQLIVWLRELEQSLAETVISPELILVDPELRRLATLAAEPRPEPEQEQEPEPISDLYDRPVFDEPDRARRPWSSALPGLCRRLRASRVDPDRRDRPRVLRAARLHRAPDQHSLRQAASCAARGGHHAAAASASR